MRNLIVRQKTTLAAGVGVAFVVLVLAAALMLTEGVKQTMGSSGSPDDMSTAMAPVAASLARAF